MSLTLAQQMGDDTPGPKIFDFSVPHWPAGEPYWAARQRELTAESARLAAQAEQLLGSPDAVGVLRGLGLALLSIRAELAAEDFDRER